MIEHLYGTESDYEDRPNSSAAGLADKVEGKGRKAMGVGLDVPRPDAEV
jgi:hypothetical protein